jgi:AcrR family transcriptional regulator
MGTKERQERERELVRRAIVEAARELFVAEGFGKVSMRKIAERIEYSPAAIYSYYPSKDDIFYALAEEGFRLLTEGLDADDAEIDPLDLVRSGLTAMYRFSQSHPEYYALMFLDRSVPHLKDSQERIPKFTEVMNRMVGATQRCIDAGLFPAGSDPFTIFRVMTVAVHGAAATNVCGRLKPGQHGDALAHDLIELMLAGFRAGVTLTFVGRPCPDEPAEAAPSAGAINGRAEPVES